MIVYNYSKKTLLPPQILVTHHASESEQRRLDLRHVSVFKQVVGFEEIMRLQAEHCGGSAEVSQVLELKSQQTNIKSVVIHISYLYEQVLKL